MKLKFRKITSLLASGVMLVSTLGFAMAANYPSPFVVGSNADVAIVYGTGAGVSSLDLIQAGNIQTNLQSSLGTSSSGTSTSVSGEAYALFTSSSKIYMNESLNSVRTTLTDTELPTVLADGTFEGDVTADYTQTIVIGSTPILEFGNHPTSDDDPTVAFSTGTSTANVMYNMTVTFDQAVTLNHTDSVGESMTIFGKDYTVGAGTTGTKLYLYESSETVALSVGGSDPTSQTVTVNGATYTVELTGASDTAATIKVTDSTGASQTKEINEDASKKVQGIDVAINLADEDTATNRLTAEVTIGANKILLQNGNKIKVGSDETSIDGTLVTISSIAASTGFTIGVVPDDSDIDALVVGDSFTDPVFGTIKIDFSSLYADDDRESITIAPAGGDKATIEMTTHNGDTKKINWVYNDSVTARLADSGDSGNDKIKVLEGEFVNITQYVVLGNEDEGYLLEFYQFSNDSDTRKDEIKFRDVFNTDDTYSVTGITTEGSGQLIVGGKTYTVAYYDETAEGADYVTIAYPDTTGTSSLVLYPTIQTSKGAKVAFYEPKTINLVDVEGYGAGLDGGYLYLPDGDGYSSIAFTDAGNNNWTVTASSTAGSAGSACTYAGASYIISTNVSDYADCTIGQLKYRVSGGDTTANQTTIYLLDALETSVEANPGIVIFEEKDDNNAYEALIVEYDDKASASELAGVADVETTWNADGVGPDWDEIQMEATDDDMYASYDLWGTLMLLDKSDSDQYSLEISYPDEQVHAQVYVGEESSTITAGSSGSTSTPLGEVLVKDSEVSSVATKNLVVVGGSCINSAAASLVGEVACGARFTELTGAGSGQFLIKGYSSSSVTSKMALMVAGYEAADTVNAAKYLTTQTVDTSKEYLGTSSTSATLVTATA